MNVKIPDTVSKTAVSTFEDTWFSVTQKPGIEIDECSELSKDADAVIVRSYRLHDLVFGGSLKAIGRAGAGVNQVSIIFLLISVPIWVSGCGCFQHTQSKRKWRKRVSILRYVPRRSKDCQRYKLDFHD